jgi:hypothetical protein
MRHKLPLLVIALLLLPALPPVERCSADPPASGDWIITGPEWYSTQTLQLMGNLTVQPGGSLRLTNVKLGINSTYDGELHIEVQPGGQLTIDDADANPGTPDDGTEIKTSGGGHYLFWVRAGAKFTLRNSIIRDCGYGLGTRGENAGVYIQSGDSDINGSTFSDCWCGLAVDNCAPRVVNNTFFQNDKYGMYARDTTLRIEGNMFDQNAAHGLYLHASEPVLSRNVFRGNMLNGILAYSSPLTMEYNTFQLNKWRGVDADKSSITSRHDEFYGNVAGFYANDSSLDIESDYFQYNTYNLVLSDVKATMRNTTMLNTTTYDLSLSRYKDRSELYSFNTSFTNVTFGDPWSTVYVRWTVSPKVVWESTKGPVPEALIRIFDNKHANIYNLSTDANGDAGPLVMTQFEQTKNGKVDPNPYRFGVFSGRFFNSSYFSVDREMAPILVLDDVPPVFTLQTPRENITTAKDRLDVNGTMASDIEASLTINGMPVWIEPESGNFTTRVNLSEGRNTVVVTALDNIGNVYTLTRNVTRDSTPPNLTINIPDEGLLLNRTTFQLRGSTEPLTYVKVNGMITDIADDGSFRADLDLVEGPNQLVVFSADQYSNGKWQNRTITVDTVAPSIEFLSPDNGSVTNRFFVQVSGRTEEEAVVVLEGVELELIRGNFSVQANLTEGDNPEKFIVRDRAGNQRTETLVIRLDTSPARYEITYPQDGSYLNKERITVSGWTEPGVRVICRDGNVTVSTDGNFTILCNLTVGPNNILIELRDQAGNNRPVSLNLVLDIEISLTLRSPANHTKTTEGAIWLEGTAEPNQEFLINYMNVTVDSAGYFSAKVGLKKGQNTITLNITDRAGNVGNYQLLVVREDPPVADLAGIAVLSIIIVAFVAGAIIWVHYDRKAKKAAAKKLKATSDTAPERLIFKAPEAPQERLRCGSCLEPIEEYWAKCHNCNAPIKLEDVLARTMDKLMGTEFKDERQMRLKASLTEAHVEMGELREDGQDVTVYFRDLILSAQMLLRNEKLDKAQALASGMVKEIGERTAKLRVIKAQETEHAETELKEEARVFLEETEPAMDSLRAAGADIREIEKMFNMAKLQLRAGNITKGHKYAKKARKMVLEMKERLELDG